MSLMAAAHRKRCGHARNGSAAYRNAALEPTRTRGFSFSHRMPPDESTPLELTVVMPCLNEADTLATCIRKALAAIKDAGVAGEVVVADNGSTDGSPAIATEEGAL